MDIFDVNWLAQLEAAVKVTIAAILGGVIGLERENLGKPAGLRTHAMLAAAVTLIVTLTGALINHFDDATPSAVLRVDPVRVIEAVVTGVAFLGAGTIFRHHGEDVVEGLTTAASMFLVAAIALAVALEQLLAALLVTALSLALLRALARWTKD